MRFVRITMTLAQALVMVMTSGLGCRAGEDPRDRPQERGDVEDVGAPSGSDGASLSADAAADGVAARDAADAESGCGSLCLDLSNDPLNCGAYGTQCPDDDVTGSRCVEGVCRTHERAPLPPGCSEPFGFDVSERGTLAFGCISGGTFRMSFQAPQTAVRIHEQRTRPQTDGDDVYAILAADPEPCSATLVRHEPSLGTWTTMATGVLQAAVSHGQITYAEHWQLAAGACVPRVDPLIHCGGRVLLRTAAREPYLDGLGNVYWSEGAYGSPQPLFRTRCDADAPIEEVHAAPGAFVGADAASVFTALYETCTAVGSDGQTARVPCVAVFRAPLTGTGASPVFEHIGSAAGKEEVSRVEVRDGDLVYVVSAAVLRSPRAGTYRHSLATGGATRLWDEPCKVAGDHCYFTETSSSGKTVFARVAAR